MPVPALGHPTDTIDADLLATVPDLMKMPGIPAGLDPATATLLLQAATAVVQAAAGGQRIVLVVDDEVILYGDTDRLLVLPQRPIVDVTSVTYDGQLLTQGTASGNWRRAASGIWRDRGWTTRCGVPTETVPVYSHGYAADDQRIQLARSATLTLAKGPAANPTGATMRRVDDYAEAYDKASAALEASPWLAKALRRQYGAPAGPVRVG